MPVAKVLDAEKFLLDHLRASAKPLRDELVAKKSFKGLEDRFMAAMKEARARFR